MATSETIQTGRSADAIDVTGNTSTGDGYYTTLSTRSARVRIEQPFFGYNPTNTVTSGFRAGGIE